MNFLSDCIVGYLDFCLKLRDSSKANGYGSSFLAKISDYLRFNRLSKFWTLELSILYFSFWSSSNYLRKTSSSELLWSIKETGLKSFICCNIFGAPWRSEIRDLKEMVFEFVYNGNPYWLSSWFVWVSSEGSGFLKIK